MKGSGAVSPPTDAAALLRVGGCLRTLNGRSRIEQALRGVATVTWSDSFGALRAMLDAEPAHVAAVVVDPEDSHGNTAAGFARDMSTSARGTAVIVYAARQQIQQTMSLLSATGIHDLLLTDHNDQGPIARSIILSACAKSAADLVVGELNRRVPARLRSFAETVVRNPSRGSITQVADFMDIHRQTPNLWCRKEKYLRPEELLVWCRLLLVSAMLELTPRTVDSLAIDLDYPSVGSLRNQLKNYTGMTATEIRTRGLDAVLVVFDERVVVVRGDLGGLGGVSGLRGLGTPPVRLDPNAKRRWSERPMQAAFG